MLLKFKPFETSDTYTFIDPDTQFKYQEPTMDALIHRIVTYRAQNALPPIEELRVVVENYLCHRPQNVGRCNPNTKISRSLWKYIKGGVTLIKNLTIENPVTQELADKRSAQCKTCLYNYFPDRGAFIRWSDSMAEAAVGNKKSKHHNALGNCEVCSCCLKAKVWVPGPHKPDKDEIPKFQEVNCWQITESQSNG